MNLWMQIMLITMLGIITMSSQSEEGVNAPVPPSFPNGETSLQSEDNQLVIPAGDCENCIVNKRKIEEAIALQYNDISKVSHLSFFRTTHSLHHPLIDFNVSFTVETTSGTVYEDIQCEVWAYDTSMTIRNCFNDQVKLSEDKHVSIQYEDIMITDARQTDPRPTLN